MKKIALILLLCFTFISCNSYKPTLNTVHNQNHEITEVSIDKLKQSVVFKDSIIYRDSIKFIERVKNDTVYREKIVKIWCDRQIIVHDTVFIENKDSVNIQDLLTDNEKETVVVQPTFWDKIHDIIGFIIVTLVLLVIGFVVGKLLKKR